MISSYHNQLCIHITVTVQVDSATEMQEVSTQWMVTEGQIPRKIEWNLNYLLTWTSTLCGAKVLNSELAHVNHTRNIHKQEIIVSTLMNHVSKECGRSIVYTFKRTQTHTTNILVQITQYIYTDKNTHINQLQWNLIPQLWHTRKPWDTLIPAQWQTPYSLWHNTVGMTQCRRQISTTLTRSPVWLHT